MGTLVMVGNSHIGSKVGFLVGSKEGDESVSNGGG